jgi:hypothetical protein
MNDLTPQWRDRLLNQESASPELQQRHTREVEKMYIQKMTIKNRIVVAVLAAVFVLVGLLFLGVAYAGSITKAVNDKFVTFEYLGAVALAVVLAGILWTIGVLVRGRYHVIRFRKMITWILWMIGLLILFTLFFTLDLSRTMDRNITPDIFIAPLVQIAVILFAFSFWRFFMLSRWVEQGFLDLNRRLLELELRLEQAGPPNTSESSNTPTKT